MKENFPDHYIRLLEKGDKPENILLFSEGGSGKTYSLVKTAAVLLEKKIKVEGKTVTPLLLQANRSALSVSDSFIMDRFLSLCGKTETVDKKDIFAAIEKNVLQNEKAAYHYVIMLDGINELGNNNIDKLLNEVEYLSVMKNVSFIVTSRNRVSRLEQLGFIVKNLMPLDDSVFEKYVADTKSFSEEQRNMLKKPFYISKFVQMYNENKCEFSTPYEVLDQYVKWSVSKQKITDIPVSERDEFFFGLLPMMCFDAAGIPSMFITDKAWQKALQTVRDKSDLLRHTEKLFGLAVQAGILLLVEDGTFKLSHEIYRDFLAAVHFKNCVSRWRVVTDKQFKLSSELLDFVKYALFKRQTDAEGRFAVSGDDVLGALKFNDIGNDKDKFKAFACAFYIFVYSLLESINNGDEMKKRFCSDYRGMTKKAYDKFEALYSTGSVTPDLPILEIVRIYSEMLRRTEEYDKSIDVSKRIEDLCKEAGVPHYWLDARHNIVRAKLCRIYDNEIKLSEKMGRQEDEFCSALTDLKTLSDQNEEGGYSPSSNLYCFLLSYPPPAVAGYIKNGIFGDESERIITATKLNFDMVKRKWKNNPNHTAAFYYPLQQCVSAIAGGKISVKADVTDDFSFYLVNMAKAEFVPYDEALRDGTCQFAESAFSFLKRLRHSDALPLIYVKFLLLYDKDKLLKTYGVLRNAKQPLARFIYSALNNDSNAAKTVNIIEYRISKALKAPGKVDSYNAVYILADIKNAWDILKELRPYPQNYLNAVNNLLKIGDMI